MKLYYVDDSHESAAFAGEYHSIDWDAEGLVVTYHDEYETLPMAMEAANGNGVGIYLLSEDTDGRYTGIIRVVRGSAAEFRIYDAI